MRPITLEPLARSQIRALPDKVRDEFGDALLRLAGAIDPTMEVDPHMPGGLGPIPYHGVLLTEHTESVVTFYVERIRVVAVRTRA
ncbi:hypothetical protein [Nocardiopsis suaedae]|uniref:Type II toxin-antitoxin system RelE/ParE family toxin n=1 Tax=Nocardiopsis suaedae TaxID=3018444 RepID=A0ABT4THC9_9ACTN|nr:hypothetical protein [Nocardiopsis suaedae]MDA2804122.1 hypothetical protein [Nocardiopsis suaedae]